MASGETAVETTELSWGLSRARDDGLVMFYSGSETFAEFGLHLPSSRVCMDIAGCGLEIVIGASPGKEYDYHSF